MKIGTAAEVRATIARQLLGDQPDEAMGHLVLRPHQMDAVGRVTRLLAQHGGALLADDVGLGKTFVALAIAREAQQPWVIAPAAVRDHWIATAAHACVRVHVESFESLARRGPSLARPGLVVIDEAHHLRNTGTRRFAAAAALCRGAQVLLLSATPVQNRLADLRNLLSLFLGERAHALPETQLPEYVVRRVERDLPAGERLDLPHIEAPQWLPPVPDVDCLDRILRLPPPVPPADGDDGGALLLYSVTRQWASSRAALRGALRRRLARGLALQDALAAGRIPSRAELAAWSFADGAQQLSFPELTVRAESADAALLLAQVRSHGAAVRELLAWLDASDDPDRSRIAHLLALLARRRGERVVAFSEYADTINAYYHALAPRGCVAMLSHAGGRVAGGAVSRGDLLQRFAPGASARSRPSERIDLLLTTDVLSEGVSLQDASVVVHLDLAWNPARLEQRVGRLRRFDAARDSIGVFVMPPPAPAERLLDLERRLRDKLAIAGRSIGLAGAILPGMTVERRNESLLRGNERIAAAVKAWRADAFDAAPPITGAARSDRSGALACVRRDGVVTLLALRDVTVTDDRGMVEDVIAAADGEDAAASPELLQETWRRVERWLRVRARGDVMELPAVHVAHSRRSLLHRVDAIARRAPRHSQPRLAPLMRAARTAATATLSTGAERVLAELSAAAMADEAWLHAVSEFATMNVHPAASEPPEVLALLVLCRA